MKKISPMWKRIGLGLIGLLAALGAAANALPEMTIDQTALDQLSRIPLGSWMLALVALMSGIFGKHDEVQE